MDDLVTLQVDGVRYEGWTRIAVDRGLDALCGAFNLAVTERWPGQTERWVIPTGASCQVAIGGEVVVTGFVDDANVSIDPDSHPVDISGRDKTCDLVDCSAVHKPGSWSNRTIEQIARDLVTPFGVTVRAEAAVGAPFKKFALQQGESVYEALERMGRMRGLLPVTNAQGELELRRPGSTDGGYALEEGVNLKSVRRRSSTRERFSQYIVKGQASGDDVSGEAARPSAEAKDGGVARYRPLVIVNGEQSTKDTLADRAKWEATVRAGKAEEVVCVVVGWRDPAGALFRQDVVIQVTAPSLGVNDRLLVSSVRFALDDRGKVTELTCVPKEAFSLLAISESEGSK